MSYVRDLFPWILQLQADMLKWQKKGIVLEGYILWPQHHKN